MVVREEDLPEVEEADARAQQLALRAFPAVEEQALASAAHERGSHAPPRGGRGGRGAEEDDVEVHRAIVDFRCTIA